jgi:hypothetical protein
MFRSTFVALAFVACAVLMPCDAVAQHWQGELHPSVSRTTQTHQDSWGGGAQIQATFGSKTLPVQLAMSLGGDGMKQQNDGPTQRSVGYDVTLQSGGSSALTPYAGGSVSANWLSGTGAPSGTLAGFEYLFGLQVKPKPTSPMAFKLEIRSGYVNTQEHTVTGRIGILHSL